MKNLERKNYSLLILRNYVALTMLIHAVTRIYVGGVPEFGKFLTLQGFPLGCYLALNITLFEIIGAVLLITGRFVSVAASLFTFHLLMGIILVHASEGWFVVGLGRNGMEYSVLLIIVFLVVAWTHKSGSVSE